MSTKLPPTTSEELRARAPRVWWSNAAFFTGVHVLAAVGIYFRPVYTVSHATLLLCFLSWQLGCFGCASCPEPAHVVDADTMDSITIGYHRMWSHRAFRGNSAVRLVLAVLGASATQGSIKVCPIAYLSSLLQVLTSLSQWW